MPLFTHTKSLDDEQLALLQLSCVDGIGPITGRGLLEHFGNARSVISASKEELKASPCAGSKLINLINDNSGILKAQKELDILQTLAENGRPIHLYFMGDDEYPSYLSHCFDAPLVIYVRGSIPVNSPMISIVGTRRNTYYAEESLRYLISGIANLRPDITIVSGLAYGVDRLAHELAIEYGLRTLAVIAHGHYTLYPSAHIKLANKIIESGGGIISEYTYNTRPLPQRFVARNRIIAGLSQGTIIIESGMKGGSLITGNIAFDYGRQVFAVPGRLFDNTSDGCNKMIALNKASIITSPMYLLQELNLLEENKRAKQQMLPFGNDDRSNTVGEDKNTDPIITLLREHEILTIEDLSLRLGEDLSTISAHLFDLELDEKIRALPGGKYTIRNY